VRSSAAVVLVASLLVAGCARGAPTLTSTDRQACQRFAARAADPGSATYDSVFAECVRNTLHPQRGGG
jgi:uncharacterized lipoprotein YajG